MLKEGHKHLSGLEEAVMKNIEACKGLAQITRTSMGPNGAPCARPAQHPPAQTPAHCLPLLPAGCLCPRLNAACPHDQLHVHGMCPQA